jgi:hypothetical protein
MNVSMPLHEAVKAQKPRAGKQRAETGFDDDAYLQEAIALVTQLFLNRCWEDGTKFNLTRMRLTTLYNWGTALPTKSVLSSLLSQQPSYVNSSYVHHLASIVLSFF